MTDGNEPPRALVFSGGSVYPAYEVGAMKATFAGESPGTGLKPIDPVVYVGTSTGAVNAAELASRSDGDPVEDVSYLEDDWLGKLTGGSSGESRAGAIRIRGDVTRFLNPAYLATNPLMPFYLLTEDAATFLQFGLSRAVQFFSDASAPIGRRLLEFADAAALIDVERFTRTIYECIDLRRIRDSGKALRIAATNWRTGLLRQFANHDMTDEIGHEAVKASSRFPNLPPIYIEGDPDGDGGCVLNTPLSPAIRAGADELHVAFIDSDIKNIAVRRLENTFDVIDGFYRIAEATIFRRDIDAARKINRGPEVLAGAGAGPQLTGADFQAFVGAGRLLSENAGTPGAPRILTVHLYHPRDDLGGVIGLVNFDYSHISDLPNRGYADTVAHDCEACGYVVPRQWDEMGVSS